MTVQRAISLVILFCGIPFFCAGFSLAQEEAEASSTESLISELFPEPAALPTPTYWFAPEAEIGQWPWEDEKYFPISYRRYEEWLNELAKHSGVSSADTPHGIAKLTLYARYRDGVLADGTGEARLNSIPDEETPVATLLTPCSLAVSDLHQEEDRLTFSWSQKSSDNENPTFEIFLPPVPETTLYLDLPSDQIPILREGTVYLLQNQTEGDTVEWAIHPGAVSLFHLTIEPKKGESSSQGKVGYRQELTAALSEDSLVVESRFVFDSGEKFPSEMMVILDQPLLLTSASWENLSLSVPSEDSPVVHQSSAFGTTRLTILPPAADSLSDNSSTENVPRVLTIRTIAPFSNTARRNLPGIRLLSDKTFWKESSLKLEVLRPLRVLDLEMTEMVRIFNRFAVESPKENYYFFQFFEPNARLTLLLDHQTETLRMSGTHEIELEERQIRVRSRLEFPDQVRFINLPLGSDWEIETVNDPNGGNLYWSILPETGMLSVRFAGQESHRELIISSRYTGDPAGAKPLNLLIPLDLTQLPPGEEYAVIPNPAEGRLEWSDETGLVQPSFTMIKTPFPETPARSGEGALPENSGAVRNNTMCQAILLGNDSSDLILELIHETPTFQAQIEGKIEILPEAKLLEEWKIDCKAPPFGRIEKVYVGFYRENVLTDDIEWNWRLTGESEYSFQVRLLSEEERLALGLPVQIRVWEIHLHTSRSAAFQIQANRERDFSGDVDIPLPLLPESNQQTARVTVCADGEMIPEVRFLSAIPSIVSEPPAGEYRTALSSWNYLPDLLRRRSGRTPSLHLIRADSSPKESEPVNGAVESLSNAILSPTVSENEKGGIPFRPSSSGVTAWCWFMRFGTSMEPNGMVRSSVLLRIENAGRKNIRITLPIEISLPHPDLSEEGEDAEERSELNSIWVNGERTAWETDEDHSILVELPERRRWVDLKIEYSCQGAPLGIRTQVFPEPPRLDIPILTGEWHLWTAPDFEVTASELDLVSESENGAKSDLVSEPEDPSFIPRGWNHFQLSLYEKHRSVEILNRNLIAIWKWALFLLTLVLTWQGKFGHRIILIGLIGICMSLYHFLPKPLAEMDLGIVLGAVCSLGFILSRIPLKRKKPEPSDPEDKDSSLDSEPSESGIFVGNSVPPLLLILGALFVFSVPGYGASPDTVFSSDEISFESSEAEPPRVFIPYDETFQPMKEGRVWLPESYYRSLLDAVARQQTSFDSRLIKKARYEGTISIDPLTHQWSLFPVKASYTVHLLPTENGTTLFRLPRLSILPDSRLFFDHQPIEPSFREKEILLELPNHPRTEDLSAADAQTGSDLGDHLLEMTLTPSGRSTEIPPVLDSRLVLRVPTESGEVRIPEAHGMVSRNGGLLTAELGAVSSFTVDPVGEPGRIGTAKVEAEQFFSLRSRPNQIALTGRIRFRITEGGTDRLTIQTDPRYFLAQCSCDNEQESTILRGGTDRSLLQIQFSKPVSGLVTFQLEFVLRDFSGIGQLQLPRIYPPGARLTRSWLALYESPMTEIVKYPPPEIASGTFQSLAGVDDAPLAVYDLNTEKQNWGISIRSRGAKFSADEGQTLNVDTTWTHLAYHALLNVEGELFDLSLSIPKGLTSVKVSLMETPDSAPREIEPLLSEGRLHLNLHKPISGTAYLTIDGDLATEMSEEMLPVPVITLDDEGEKPENIEIQHTERTLVETQGTVPERMRVRRNRARVSGEVRHYLFCRSTGEWEILTDFQLEILDGAVDKIELEFDERCSGPFSVEPSIPLNLVSTPRAQRLTLLPSETVSGNFAFRVRTPVQISSGQGIELPKVRILSPSVDEDLRTVVFLPEMNRENQQQYQWEIKGYRPIELGDSLVEEADHSSAVNALAGAATPERHDNQKDLFPAIITKLSTLNPEDFLSYTATGEEDPRILLSMVQPSETFQCETNYFVRPDGLIYGRAFLEARGTDTASRELRMTPGTEILQASIDGARCPLMPLSSGHWLVPPPVEGDYFHLELMFQIPVYTPQHRRFGENRHRYIRYEFTPPTLGDKAAQRTYWSIAFESDNGKSYPCLMISSDSDQRPEPPESLPTKAESVSTWSESGWQKPLSYQEALPCFASIRMKQLNTLLDLLESVSSDPESVRRFPVWRWLWEEYRLGINEESEEWKNLQSRYQTLVEPFFARDPQMAQNSPAPNSLLAHWHRDHGSSDNHFLLGASENEIRLITVFRLNTARHALGIHLSLAAGYLAIAALVIGMIYREDFRRGFLSRLDILTLIAGIILLFFLPKAIPITIILLSVISRTWRMYRTFYYRKR